MGGPPNGRAFIFVQNGLLLSGFAAYLIGGSYLAF